MINLKTLHYSTVTDLPMSTPTDNLIPFITFIYSFKINKKGEMIEGKYSDFGMGFYESY